MTATAPIRDVLATGYQAHRDPEPGWRARLAEHCPPNEQIPYLWLDWLAGDPWEPIQRWALWEVMPAALCDRLITRQRLRLIPDQDILLVAIVRDLNDVSPRDPSKGRWQADPTIPEHLGGRRWISDSLVNLQQWELWHRLKGFATLWWIIEGAHGGHKRRFSDLEAAQLKRLGLPNRAPVPGSQPYAPFDNRVLEQLRRFDKASHVGDFRRRTRSHQAAVEQLEADRLAEETAAAAASDEWLSLQMAEAVDELSDRRISNLVAHLPVREPEDRRLILPGGF